MATLTEAADWFGDDDMDLGDVDVCVHGRPFDVICVDCCPEDDDGSDTGDEWSEQ